MTGMLRASRPPIHRSLWYAPRVDPLLALVTTFPVVVYTVLLGAALAYWLFVMVGAVHVDHLHGADALDGLDALDAAHAHDAGDGHAHGDGHGALEGIVAALKLRSAPASVVLSLVVLFAWLFSALGVRGAEAALPEAALGAARAALFVLAPILALFPTSLALRPLAGVFTTRAAPASKELVGRLCTIRTGTVTDRFGEATLEDGGAGLVVRVRVESGEKLQRGQQAVILGYDEVKHEFTVAPMDPPMDPPTGARVDAPDELPSPEVEPARRANER